MVIAAIIFIILGIVIKYGKMYFLLAGYNTMPKEDREKYDIQGIANIFHKVMWGMAIVIILGYLAAKWSGEPIIEMLAFWGSVIIGVPYLIIQSNSKKYKIK